MSPEGHTGVRADILGLDRGGLAQRMRDGHPIDPGALDDQVYRGISLGLPPWIESLTWKTFQKTFHRDPVTGHLRGWNVRIQQHGLDAPSVPMQRNGAPVTFGHYRVVSCEGCGVPSGAGAGAGLLIDYGLGGNPMMDPMRLLRDPLVALVPGGVQWLLGGSYLQIATLRIGTPSYFLLEREHPLTHRVSPPRPAH